MTVAGGVRLAAGAATLAVDPADGGRWTSWRIDGLELLAGADTGIGPAFARGCFPMAPFAGRLRDGRVTIGGRERTVARDGAHGWSGAHAIHGTVADRRWTITEAGPAHATLAADLGPRWPAAGAVRQRLRLHPDRLEAELALDAVEAMPVTLGWHPWFARRLARGGPASWTLQGGRHWRTGSDGLPTGELGDPPPGPWDDAFHGFIAPPAIRWPGALRLALHTTAPDAVLFDALHDVLCLEPQTGPPDAARLGRAELVPAGGTTRLATTWRWAPDDRA